MPSLPWNFETNYDSNGMSAQILRRMHQQKSAIRVCSVLGAMLFARAFVCKRRKVLGAVGVRFCNVCKGPAHACIHMRNGC